MNEKKRIVQLLSRELDGEMTPLEKDELQRSILMEPELRREREAWKRVTGALSEGTADPKARLDVGRLTSRVLASTGPRIPARPRWSWLLAASTAFVVGGLLIAVVNQPEERAPAPVAARALDVDGFFGVASADDDRAAPVEIRF